MTQNHTPTPWIIGEICTEEDCEGLDIIPFIEICREIEAPHPDYKTVCKVDCSMNHKDLFYIGEEDRANAAFIVRACNSHAALVDLLVRIWIADKEAMENLKIMGLEKECDTSVTDEIKATLKGFGYDVAALALAKGE